MLHLDDTIAAIATPPGEGGIGIIRLSGPDAVSIAAKLFQPTQSIDLQTAESHRLYYGHMVVDGETLDEVLLAIMRAPHSYTHEDVVEIQGHGSPVILRTILDALLQSGARSAEPGEFTQRAFLNGRLSLDQSQAVLDVIQAKTQLSAHYALDRLQGKFSQPLHQVRDQLTELLAGVGVGIDYPEYEDDAIPQSALIDGLQSSLTTVNQLLEHAKDGRLLKEGYSIAIVGRPNVGKSTLLNALLQTNRALVTAMAGTTRDTLEEFVDIQGIPFRLIDTAGLHESRDEVEQLGMERTQEALANADLVLVILDMSQAINEQDQAILQQVLSQEHLIVLNKLDLCDQHQIETISTQLQLDTQKIIGLSAETGENLETLKDTLVKKVWGGELSKHEDIFFLDLREKELLRRGQHLLQQAWDTVSASGTLDLVAIEIQEALEVFGELTGESASEAVIERIFAKFCVGK